MRIEYKALKLFQFFFLPVVKLIGTLSILSSIFLCLGHYLDPSSICCKWDLSCFQKHVIAAFKSLTQLPCGLSRSHSLVDENILTLSSHGNG